MTADSAHAASDPLETVPAANDPRPYPELANKLDIQSFRGVAMDAYTAARHYNGTAMKRDMLLQAIHALHNFIAPYCQQSGYDENTILPLWGREYGAALGEDLSVQKLYDQAFANIVPITAAQHTAYQRLFPVLFKGMNVDIETINEGLIIPFGKRDSLTGSLYHPHLATVLQALTDRGFSLEDMMFMVPDIASESQLAKGHIVITLPDVNCQIAISDYAKNNIFFQHGIAGIESWQMVAKGQEPSLPVFMINGDQPSSVYKSIFDQIGQMPKRTLDKVSIEALPVIHQQFSKSRVLRRTDKEAPPLGTFERLPTAPTARGLPRIKRSSPAVTQNMWSGLGVPEASETEEADVTEEEKAVTTPHPHAWKAPAGPVAVVRPQSRPKSPEEADLEKARSFPGDLADFIRAFGVLPQTHFTQGSRRFENSMVSKWRAYSHWMSVRSGLSLETYIERWIDRQVKRYKDSHEQQEPDRTSGIVTGTLTWEMLDDALANHAEAIANLHIFQHRTKDDHLDCIAAEAVRRQSSSEGLPAKAYIPPSDAEQLSSMLDNIVKHGRLHRHDRMKALYHPQIWESWLMTRIGEYRLAQQENPTATADLMMEGEEITWAHAHKACKSYGGLSGFMSVRLDILNMRYPLAEKTKQKKKAAAPAPAPVPAPVSVAENHFLTQSWAGVALTQLTAGTTISPAAVWDSYALQFAAAVMGQASTPVTVLTDTQPADLGHDDRGGITAMVKFLMPEGAPEEPPILAEPEQPASAVAATPASADSSPSLQAMLNNLITKKKFPVYNPDGSPGVSTWTPWVQQIVAAHISRHGADPHRLSGAVDGYPDMTWAVIDQAIYGAGRIHKRNLESFIQRFRAPIKKLVSVPVDEQASVIPVLVQSDFESVAITVAAAPKPEPQESVVDSPSPAVPAESLQKEGFEPLNPRSQVMMSFAVHKRFPLYLFDGSKAIKVWQDFVRELVQAHRRKFGADPQLDQPVDGFPDFENWGVIDQAILLQSRPFKYGLAVFIERYCQDKAGKRPAAVKPLTDFAKVVAAAPVQQTPPAQPVRAAFKPPSEAKRSVDSGIVAMTVPDFDARAKGQINKTRTVHYMLNEHSPQNRAEVIERVLKYIADKKRFPDEHDRTMKQYDRQEWKEQSCWLLVTENHTLRQFIPAMICELAAAHYQSHQHTEPDKNSGAIPGYDQYSWSMIFDAYGRDGRWPMPLAQVIHSYLYKHGVPAKPVTASMPAPVCK